jgi:dihydrofolate synthase / folylpolyglutamate synthase
MRRLCLELGNPEKGLKFIHIAGTNGKGSVAAFLHSVLAESGYRAGLYTSPHLVEMGERIQVCGQQIPRDDIVRLTLKIRSLMEGSPELKDTSYFEFMTTMALLYFEEKKVEIVIWETGLGGRLDATNVVDPECCVITGIGYDHLEYLGATLGEIALEKAGILKAGKPLVLASQAPEAREVILERAKNLGCPVFPVPEAQAKGVWEIDSSNQTLVLHDKGNSWCLGLAGTYQVSNASLALEICEVLQSLGFPIPTEARKKGLESARWPGRFEFLQSQPPWVVDGAHNVEGLQSALASWQAWFGEAPRQVIFGCASDKNLDAMAALLYGSNTLIRLVRLSTARSQCLERMKEAFTNPSVTCFDSLTEAVAVCRSSGQSTLIVGSLYLAGEMLALTRENQHELKLNG